MNGMKLLRPFLLIALVAALPAFWAACSGINDPSKNVNVDFTGTLEQNEGDVFEFDVNKGNGEYTAQLTALAPDPSSGFSIYLGQVVNGLCTPILGQQGTARLNQIALNSTIQKGHYCIQLFDLGFIPRAQTYTLHVSHP